MMTVRFPNGQAITYNNGGFLQYTPDFWEIYTASPSKGGHWIASIQARAGAIVETSPPCQVKGLEFSLLQAFEKVQTELWELPAYKLKTLKNALTKFNTKTEKWRR